MARTAVQRCVEERLAACGNIIPQVESIYRWEGKVETAGEVLVILKTTGTAYEALEAKVRSLHPYEVREIIATPLSHGSAAYLDWVRDSCAPGYSNSSS